MTITDQLTMEQRIATFIKELAPGHAGEVQPDDDLREIIDSTALMELVLWVEETFGVTAELDDITAENFGSVRKMAAWINRHAAN